MKKNSKDVKKHSLEDKLDLKKVTLDTSIIIERVISRKIKNKTLNVDEIYIHEASLAELEHQANQKKTIGFIGLNELDELKKLSETHGFDIVYDGDRPHFHDIENAKSGGIDSMIRNLAYDSGSVLLSCDMVQSLVSKGKGIESYYFKVEKSSKKLSFEKYFDKKTMSVHIRENVAVMAKKGHPGKWKFEKVTKTKTKRQRVVNIASEIVEEAESSPDGFLEIERKGSSIVQLSKYRIVITRPPFSDRWEITIVRPVKKLKLKDYKLNDELKSRLLERAEGIIISGAPGQGKSTFAQALAERYDEMDKVVKTVEAPRDLQLSDSVIQYAMSHGSQEEIHDILLLSRPDYTIYDEMRNLDDFELFSDMRLAGVGMIGVVHATNPIDSIHRFIGKVELGMIPQILDTVVYIKGGQVNTVFGIKMEVRVPTGMTESDLARPVVLISDYETGEAKFEIYSYGEETVVIPVNESDAKAKKPVEELAQKAIKEQFNEYSEKSEIDFISDNKIVVKLPDKVIAQVIGKGGKNIDKLEKKLGVSIDIQELDPDLDEALKFQTEIRKKNLKLYLASKFTGREVRIEIDGKEIVSAKVGKDGIISFSRDNPNAPGEKITQAINKEKDVEIYQKE
ncbi:MAG: PINc/VapC family ATPase [Candidatus Woesearchaeota archaeon]